MIAVIKTAGITGGSPRRRGLSSLGHALHGIDAKLGVFGADGVLHVHSALFAPPLRMRCSTS